MILQFDTGICILEHKNIRFCFLFYVSVHLSNPVPDGVNIFMDGCMRKMRSKVVNAGAKLRLNGEVWSVVTCLFADDTVFLAESEGDLQRVVNEFYSVCKRRKL